MPSIDVRIEGPEPVLVDNMAWALQQMFNCKFTVTILPTPAKPSGAEAAKGAAVANRYSYPSVEPGETHGQMRFREGVLRLLGMLVDKEAP
jgi:hypothetical protein